MPSNTIHKMKISRLHECICLYVSLIECTMNNSSLKCSKLKFSLLHHNHPSCLKPRGLLEYVRWVEHEEPLDTLPQNRKEEMPLPVTSGLLEFGERRLVKNVHFDLMDVFLLHQTHTKCRNETSTDHLWEAKVVEQNQKKTRMPLYYQWALTHPAESSLCVILASAGITI